MCRTVDCWVFELERFHIDMLALTFFANRVFLSSLDSEWPKLLHGLCSDWMKIKRLLSTTLFLPLCITYAKKPPWMQVSLIALDRYHVSVMSRGFQGSPLHLARMMSRGSHLSDGCTQARCKNSRRGLSGISPREEHFCFKLYLSFIWVYT